MVAAADAALTKAIRPRFIRGLLFLSEIVGFGRFRPGSGGKPICYFDLASVRARFRLAGKPHNRPSGRPKAGRRAEFQGFPIRIQAKSGPHGLARTLAGQGPTGGPLANLPDLGYFRYRNGLVSGQRRQLTARDKSGSGMPMRCGSRSAVILNAMLRQGVMVWIRG